MIERYVKRAPILAHLLAVPTLLGLVYLSWTYVSANVDLDFPPNTMGEAMVMPLKLLICMIMVGAGMTLFNFLTINFPRSVRRHFFWKRKRGTHNKDQSTKG
ncbi:hypothetical protein [Pseudomonas sp. NPDC096950]|uniref:hypothetical protein n=1 Tax=Pseudomonas sp. NPDC096950 TaxID=3364485 RepID=UPI00383B7149